MTPQKYGCLRQKSPVSSLSCKTYFSVPVSFIQSFHAAGAISIFLVCESVALFSFIISVGINLFSFGAFGGGGVTWELIKQALIGGENVTRVSVIKPELIIFALVFSVLVGLVSGYQPANKAVKISALEAIRNE